jgi:hypothetical protein
LPRLCCGRAGRGSSLGFANGLRFKCGVNIAKAGEGRVEEGRCAMEDAAYEFERHSRIRSTSLSVISFFVRS